MLTPPGPVERVIQVEIQKQGAQRLALGNSPAVISGSKLPNHPDKFLIADMVADNVSQSFPGDLAERVVNILGQQHPLVVGACHSVDSG